MNTPHTHYPDPLALCPVSPVSTCNAFTVLPFITFEPGMWLLTCQVWQSQLVLPLLHFVPCQTSQTGQTSQTKTIHSPHPYPENNVPTAGIPEFLEFLSRCPLLLQDDARSPRAFARSPCSGRNGLSRRTVATPTARYTSLVSRERHTSLASCRSSRLHPRSPPHR